jgi:hypothetical protein
MVLYVSRRLLSGIMLSKVLTDRDSVLYASRVVGVHPPKYLNVLTYRRL